MYKIFEELMREKGVNATQVSRDTGIPRTFFSDWKKGKYNPKTDKLQKLAQYFNVPIEYFTKIEYEKDLSEYYTDVKSAIIAQSMFEDPDMRTLYHIKKNIEPEVFQAHVDMIKKLYRLEHPEEFPEE